jgi:hypothetical protein
MFGYSNPQPGEDNLANRFQTSQKRRLSLYNGLKIELKTDRPLRACSEGSVPVTVPLSIFPAFKKPTLFNLQKPPQCVNLQEGPLIQ